MKKENNAAELTIHNGKPIDNTTCLSNWLKEFVYAGIMTYEKRDGRWMRVSNVSTAEQLNERAASVFSSERMEKESEPIFVKNYR